jgi:hypothetical protein
MRDGAAHDLRVFFRARVPLAAGHKRTAFKKPHGLYLPMVDVGRPASGDRE